MADAPYQAPPPAPPIGSGGTKTAILIGAIVAMLAANVYLYIQLDQLKTNTAKFRETVLTELANLRETSSVTNQTARRHIDSLRDELAEARRQASTAASQAKAEALKKADLIQQQLEAEQRKQQQQMAAEFSQVKQNTDTQFAAVNTDVTGVKSQLGSTQSELQKTISDLKKVTGDLGVQSGYIATNGQEIAALKRLGERNIVEFNVAKAKAPQRVGDISIKLTKTDPKHNKYTIEVLADDKSTEKKDRTINEPVQFYTLKAKQPYEIVVNSVEKNKIVGYLSTPKEQVARN